MNFGNLGMTMSVHPGQEEQGLNSVFDTDTAMLHNKTI